ncbi:MAG: COX15/CtaA family protein [Oligoflexia bacterium]|nr:COX15/CtaA family protein [Oligoflexia bacterium]
MTTVASKKFQLYCWFVLIFCIGVILWGAFVRATGSGAGCGEHWPLCNGEVLPTSPEWKTFVEYTHRLTSGLSLLLVIGLFVWAKKKYTHFRELYFWAKLSFIAIVIEALLGAGLVLFRYVEFDQSIGRAVSIGLHLVNTLFLLACICFTTFYAYYPQGRWRIPEVRYQRGMWILLVGYCILGALGALTALGDTLFPVQGTAFRFSQDSHFLEYLRIIHPLIACAWTFYLLVWLSTLAERIGWRKNAALYLIAAVGANICLGILNIILKAPIWMQIVHLLAADIIWVLFLWVNFSTASWWKSS